MASAPDFSWPDFFQRLEAALPVDDMLAWILREHPGVDERTVMAMVQRILQRDYVVRPSASAERSYVVGGKDWRTFPQSIAARPG